MSEYLALLEQKPKYVPAKKVSKKTVESLQYIRIHPKYEECLIFALTTSLLAYKNKNQPRKKYWEELVGELNK